MKRAFVIVLDSLGCGSCPDSEFYGDKGADTLQSIIDRYPQLSIPTLKQLNFSSASHKPSLHTERLFSGTIVARRLEEKSKGKDTTTGHWELMGLVVDHPFPLFPKGFPPEVIAAIERYSGRRVICNAPASGTEIINRLGEEHLKTGALIVYTSGDSVLQIAAHEDIVTLEELYDLCSYVRNEVMVGPLSVGRIIARPFKGNALEGFYRTSGRHDFGVKPFGKTVLNTLQEKGIPTIGVGKINDIFSGSGISDAFPTKNNTDGMATLDALLTSQKEGLIFANLVDFDMLWGHRRDVEGYAQGLESFDAWLSGFVTKLTADDLLIITADHGCDPAFRGTDHTREFVPGMWYCPQVGVDIDVESSAFSAVGKSVVSWLLGESDA